MPIADLQPTLIDLLSLTAGTGHQSAGQWQPNKPSQRKGKRV